MAHDISNTDDIIDSRDVIARIEELEGEHEALETAAQEAAESGDTVAASEAQAALDDWQDADELKVPPAFMGEIKGNGGDEEWRGDWYPVTCVRDSYFQDYAQEEAEQLDLVKADIAWPYTCIDWEQAARELQQDYTSVEFDGVTYWVR